GAAPEERDALSFLIGQTPYRSFWASWSDHLTDARAVGGALLLAHVRGARAARGAWPWARALDDDTWRRFVLAYRMTTERAVDWRTPLAEDPEIREIVGEAARGYDAAADDAARSRIFRRLLHTLNTGWLGARVPYAPRSMPDLNPLEALALATGRCTDLTNTLIGVLRAFGIAATGVRVVAWPGADGNHTWTAVYDPAAREWLDLDSGQAGSADDPAYFHRFVRTADRRPGKAYWVVPGEERGAVAAALALEPGEIWPPAIEKYLVAKPMVDRTARYAPVVDLARAHTPPGALVWLAVKSGGAWRPVAGVRAGGDGDVLFRDVGCGSAYRLLTWEATGPSFHSPVLVPLEDGSVSTDPAPEDR
ncbi:MAG: transglutaminase domain-containing protein, partial [Planctomycetes bacterium]|nr:transglutaminase domain-containing protein [Planctomycetota bacterium]